MSRNILCIFAFVLIQACGSGSDPQTNPSATPTPFVDTASVGWANLKAVTRMDEPQTGFARMYSSSNPDNGSNEDYNNYLRYEGNNTYVMAEHNGPGVLTRIWMTARVATSDFSSQPGFHHDSVLTIHTDGAVLFSIPVQQFFSGALWPFVYPLVQQHRGVSGTPNGFGFYSYVPISFSSSFKATITNPLPSGASSTNLTDRFFYQLNVLDLTGQAPVQASPLRKTDGSLSLTSQDEAALNEIAAAWKEPTKTATAWMEAAFKKEEFPAPVENLAVLADLEGPGRIRGLRLRTSGIRSETLEQIRLRAFWDDETTPSIDVPLGTAWGNHFTRARFSSLQQGAASDGTWYLALPMPFQTAARLELVNTAGPQPISAEIFWDPGPIRSEWRRLHAHFVESTVNSGARHTAAQIQASGHLAGVRMVVNVQQDSNALEGDEFFTIDNALTHRGTGAEDFFNAHWFFEGGIRSAALHGATSVLRQQGLLDVDTYRFFLGDRIPFSTNALLQIENGNRPYHKDDYRSVVFWYQSR